MELPEQRIRVVAASPIEVGDRRLLPSVLVSSLRTSCTHGGPAGGGAAIRLRPISVVLEGPESAEWIEIPNTTANMLSQMMTAAATITLVSLLIIGVSRLLRQASG
jgi:hypothetical protein